MFYINEKGVSHQYLEDAICSTPTHTVGVVCDGVSKSMYGSLIARKYAEYFTSELENGLGDCLLRASQKEERNLLRQALETALGTVRKNSDEPLNDYSTTLLAFYRKDDQLLLIHMGDGCILGGDSKSCSLLSYPFQHPTGEVIPALPQNVEDHCRILRFSAVSFSHILLCTDGLSDCFIDPIQEGYSDHRARKVLGCASQQDFTDTIHRMTDEKHITDDISALLFDVSKPEAIGREQTDAPEPSLAGSASPAENEQSENSIDAETAPRPILSSGAISVLLILLLVGAVLISAFRNHGQTKQLEQQLTALTEQTEQLEVRLAAVETDLQNPVAVPEVIPEWNPPYSHLQ